MSVPRFTPLVRKSMSLFSICWDSWVTLLVRLGLGRKSQGSDRAAVVHDARDFRKNRFSILQGKSVLWAHGASIGEVKCLAPIVSSFLKEKRCDSVLITYTSPDGLGEIRRLFDTEKSNIVTCPLLNIWPRFLKKSLSLARLQLCVIAEKDIWPRIITIARRHAAPVIVVDGRFESHRNLIKRLFRSIWYRVVAKELRTVCVPTRHDYENAKDYIPSGRLVLTGPSKAIDSISRSMNAENLRSEYTHLLRIPGKQPILVFGSIAESEARLAAEICRKFLTAYSNSVVVLAPRHTRKPEVLALFERELTTLRVKYASLSTIAQKKETEYQNLGPRVILVDKMGHLANIYSIATVALVGGSFIDSDGHNFFEPIAMRVPTICGPGIMNWNGIHEEFLRADGIVRSTPEDIVHSLKETLSSLDAASRRCERAYQILRELAQLAEQNISIASNAVN